MKKLFFIVFYFFHFNLLKSQFFINETSTSNEYYEALFNYYALKVYESTNIKIYIHYFLSSESENDQIIKEEVDNKLNELFSFYNREHDKLILAVFSLNKGVIKFKHNIKELNNEILENLNENFFKYHLGSINYILEEGSIKKIITESELLKNEEQTFSVLLSAPLTFLKGISNFLNINLSFDYKTLNLIREKEIMEKRIKDFTQASKKELKDLVENKLDKEEQNKNFEFNLEGNLNFNYSYSNLESSLKEKSKITGLLKDIQNEDNFWKCSFSLKPFIKKKDKFKFLSSFSFLSYRDYIDLNKNKGPMLRFDFLELNLFEEDYISSFRLGDLSLYSSDILLNDSLRGYQGNFEIKFNDLLDKNAFLKFSLFYAPDEEFFGVSSIDQAKISGLILNLESNGKGKNILKYIYSNAEKNNLRNLAQQLFLYSTYPINDRINYHLTLDYSLSNNLNKKEGHRFNFKYGMDFIFSQDDSLKFDLNAIYTSSLFDTILLSSKYANSSIPKYITEMSALGQWGYEFSLNNTLFKKRFTNFLKLSNHFKEKDSSTISSYYFYIFSNLILNEKLSSKFNFELKSDSEEISNILFFSANYNFLNKTPTLFLEGNFIPYYSYETNEKDNIKFFKKDRLKFEIDNRYSIYNFSGNSNFYCLYDYYSMSKEHIILANFDNNLNFKTENFLNSFSYLALIKNMFKKHTLNFLLKQGIILDNFFVNVFEINNLNNFLNTKFFSLSSNFLDEENAIYGYELNCFIPFQFLTLKNSLNIEFKGLKNDIYGEDNYNNSLNYEVRKSINNHLDLSLEYQYENYLLESSKIKNHFLRIEENGSFPKEMNKSLVDISGECYSLFNKIKNRNYYETKLKSLAHFLVNKNSIIDFELNGGIGLNKRYFTFENNNFLSYFYSTGIKIIFNISNAKLIQEFSFENHFNEYEILKRVLINKTGFYLLNKYLKSILIFNFKRETYSKEELRKYDETILGLIFKGLFNDIDKKIKLSYDIEWEDYKKENDHLERFLKGEILFNSNIYENFEQSKFQLINSSNIFLKFEINYKEIKNKNLSLSFKGGGNATFFNRWNTINIDGNLSFSLNEFKLHNELALLSIKDIQRLIDNINIVLDFKYSSNFNKIKNDFKIYSFGLSLNVTQFVLNNLNLSCNILKEVYIYPQDFRYKNKIIKKGSINICYTF